MFRKLLTVGIVAVTLIGGIGTASAWGSQYFCPGENRVRDQAPGKGLQMWVVHPERIFSSSFVKFDRKWYFTGEIWECYLDRGYDNKDWGPKYYAAEYKGEWVNKPH
ncbi:hypothetical protein [Xenorhabdus griffiniae]|uniref:hypothetical protein n=1 Tax=Xenorhabdus griffiniae TaxID=351672 RepID=UPI002358BCDD|nr:hypothetical protein [Xenorhabdus griffiniae]MDC9606965.1 hypothetical protein [Xenorhabdus griffiniae]